MKIAILWKIYFYFLCVAIPLDIFMRLLFSGFDPNWWSFILKLLLPTAIAMAGLYGFIYKKRIGRPILWKLFFVYAVVYFFYEMHGDINFLKTMAEKYDMDFRAELIGDIAESTLLELPGFIALFIYGFGMKDMWNTEGQEVLANKAP